MRFLLAFLVLAVPLCAENQTLVVSYSSSTLQIRVENQKIDVTRIQQQFDNPVSAIPSSTRSVQKTGKLTQNQVRSLRKMIQGNGFMKLDAVCGAPERERFYPYSISVKLDGKEHKVLFRSNPSFPGSPHAFQEVEKKLTDLSAAATTPVQPAESK